VLVVEDELRMAGLIRRGLVREGLAADVAEKGEDALWMSGAHEYDVIVLDVILPGIDGFETCRRLRKNGIWAPVLMLTARDSVEDRVAGLDTGADDYLVKPFAFAELLARLRALARRGDSERPNVLEVGDLRLDPATREVRRGDQEIRPSAKEFALLETFMRRPGEVLSARPRASASFARPRRARWPAGRVAGGRQGRSLHRARRELRAADRSERALARRDAAARRSAAAGPGRASCRRAAAALRGT
jgi:two-component system OmpR family response regulator